MFLCFFKHTDLQAANPAPNLGNVSSLEKSPQDASSFLEFLKAVSTKPQKQHSNTKSSWLLLSEEPSRVFLTAFQITASTDPVFATPINIVNYHGFWCQLPWPGVVVNHVDGLVALVWYGVRLN